MDELHLGQFGTPTIKLGEQALRELLPSKAQALLFYTSLSKGVHARVFLASMFWSSVDAAQGKKNLRNILPALRQHLPGVFMITRQTIEFNATVPHTIDVEHFERVLTGDLQKIALPTLLHALHRYHGDFLDRFYVRDAPIFEQWLIVQRERFYQLAVAGWYAVAQRYWAQQQVDAANNAANNLLKLQSYHEGGHRLLMRIKMQLGDKDGALAQYKRCVQALRKQIDVDVSAETRTLYDQIRQGKLKPVPLKNDQQAIPASCLCREQELTLLEQQLGRAVGEQGQAVWISGLAGSGKSILLRTFAEHVATTHPTVITIQTACRSLTAPVPYEPIRHLFAQLDIRWPESAYPEPAQLIRLLLASTAVQPLLLLIDDLQWADAASLLLIERLAAHVGPHKILLVGAYRSHWQAGERLHVLGGLSLDLEAAWKREGWRFVSARLNGEPNVLTHAFYQRLYHLTCGHPALTDAVWHQLKAQGYVARNSQGAWGMVKSIEWESLISAEMTQLIERWLTTVPESLVYLLRAACVEGEEFTAAVVGIVCGAELPRLAHQFGQLVRRFHLITEQTPLLVNKQRHARYRFTHPIMRTYLYETLTWQERTVFQEALGEAFAEFYS